ncbi:amino acid adenylation domain-containing protein [Streptosporangiaceae bacterium NEAU-GS5]|nr:amino acid adenylation domain-containing protein [Streptosporangiaceae bacterium NEAU-GS5]
MRAPLSPAQERVWLLQRMYPDDTSYNMYIVRRIEGPLDRTAFTAALGAVVDRHEGLRTRFAEVDGVPWAVVQEGWRPVIEWVDAPDELSARVILEDRVNRPFDLAAAPPLRVSVVTFGPDDHLLCAVPHHIVADGWSAVILLSDLAEFYSAHVLGRAPELPALPVQPGDYARWQRRRSDRAVPYWQDKLAEPPPPDLPMARARAVPPAERAAVWHRTTVALPVIRELERLARAGRASLFMVMMAAYQALVFRHTGRDDILTGTAVAGRDRVELEPMIGYVAQGVVLRGDLSGDPTFIELVERVRSEALDALNRPAVPFERLPHPVDAVMPSMLILHNHNEGAGRAFHGLEMSPYGSDLTQTKSGLLVEAWEIGGEFTLSIIGARELYDHEDLVCLAERFRRLLESAAAAPGTPISELDLWTPEDHKFLAATDEVAEPDFQPYTIGNGEVALVCGAETVSYAELETRVGRLAGGLRAAGVGRGDIVGVCLPRSPEAIVALLAVWRAGAAYLPLDPADPPERIASILTDAAAAGVVTRAVLPYRSFDPDVAGEPPETVNRPSDPAYVIFTSGSTGRPKGVVIDHRAVAARVAWMREAYELGPADRVVQFASLSFDAHVEEIFPALAAGAALLLLPEGAATLPDVLASPQGRSVSVLDLPTAYWHRLVDDLDEIAWPPALRLVILGGEQVLAPAVARWQERFARSARLVNTYGPTEGTVIATACDLVNDGERPPIGRPIDGASVRVADARGRPQPYGCAGELMIGGPGVAIGYLGRPGVTAAAFGPDPHGGTGGRRYRTGDRGRWRRDGRLEFLGRFDAQVKVRGFRIEPGEVESHLTALHGVREAYVTAVGDDLVAYVTGDHIDVAELRTGLAARLPRQFVPTAWVRLDALPLTRAGKVDRAALPPPDKPAAAERVPPRGDAEELVAGIWRDLLGVEPGAFDDFFALGGHSLMATRVAARLRRAVGVEVPIRTIFERPSVAGLAAAVEELVVAELAEMTDEEAYVLLAEEPS